MIAFQKRSKILLIVHMILEQFENSRDDGTTNLVNLFLYLMPKKCIFLHHKKSYQSHFESVTGSLSPLNNENKVDKSLYCTLDRLVLIRFIQRNQRHRYSVMHEFSSNVNKVNKAVAKVRTIGDRLPLNNVHLHCFKRSHDAVFKIFCHFPNT